MLSYVRETSRIGYIERSTQQMIPSSLLLTQRFPSVSMVIPVAEDTISPLILETILPDEL